MWEGERLRKGDMQRGRKEEKGREGRRGGKREGDEETDLERTRVR